MRAPGPLAPGRGRVRRGAALDAGAGDAGWDELGADERLLPLAAPAGGRARARPSRRSRPVDRLLGGALEPAGSRATPRRARRSSSRAPAGFGRRNAPRGCQPLPYTDALGVARVEAGAAERVRTRGGLRMAAWTAASTGYLAGLAEESLRLALEHARSRHAFGGPLAALEPVQQMLADAATLVDGLAPARRRPARASMRSRTRATRPSARSPSACR